MMSFFIHQKKKRPRLFSLFSLRHILGSIVLVGLQHSLLLSQTYNDSYTSPAQLTGTHSVTNEGSDYYVKVTWPWMPAATSNIYNSSASSAGPCECDDEGLTLVEYGTVQGNDNRNPVHKWTNPDVNNGDTVQVGPNYNRTFFIHVNIDGANDGPFVKCNKDCDRRGNSPSSSPVFTMQTAALKAPGTASGSTTDAQGSRLDKTVVNWTKGTDIPDNSIISYEVFRSTSSSSGYTKIATVQGGDNSTTDYTITDNGLNANTTYYYRIYTKCSKWGGHTSAPRQTSAKTLDPMVQASDGEFSNRIKISWASFATSASNIKIERKIPKTNNWEELGILNKNAQGYNDYDPIPGYGYTYRVTALNSTGGTIHAFTDVGHMKPNGIIKGRVLSAQGAGVLGVSVTATYKQSLPNNESPASGVNITNLTDVTDAGGNFEIRDIYYFDGATFVVTPTLTGHAFDPASLEVVLDLNTPQQTALSFTDTTVFTVSGNVNFPDPSTFGASGTDGGIENVKIYLDGQDLGIRTDANGSWRFAIQDEGTYSFEPEYLHHSFSPASQSVVVTGDVSNINFEDTEVDSIEVLVRGGCNSSITTPDDSPIKVRITSTAGQGNFNLLVATGNTGFQTVVLPAAEFQVTVPNADNPLVNPVALQQFADTSMIFDLSVRDSVMATIKDTAVTIIPPDTIDTGNGVIIQPGDTIYDVQEREGMISVQPEASFIYLRDLQVAVDFLASGAEVCSDNTVILQQDGLYTIAIQVTESITNCPVDTGSLRIYDYISDRDSDPIIIPIKNGFAFYELEAGLPNTANGGANPYQKLLYINAEAGTREKQAYFWAVVEGSKNLQGTFTSRSPEIPRLVVHDPPGDASYAFVEQGSDISGFEWTEYEISGQGGVFTDIQGGLQGKIFGNSVKGGVRMDFEWSAGRENFNRGGYETNISFEESYSTADDALFTGYDGDVYIGMATNQNLSVAEVLVWDETNCTASVRFLPHLSNTGIASTFIYTEKHIKSTLIPQLQFFRDAFEDELSITTTKEDSSRIEFEMDSLQQDVLNWTRILDNNAQNRGDLAEFKENISFSAGASYDQIFTQDSLWSNSYEFTKFIDISLGLSAIVEVDAGPVWLEAERGYRGSFRHSSSKDTGDGGSNGLTIGYHLEDDDIGDFFSVDVMRDKAYDVPAFKIVSGTSSCPHEPGTQQRDKANIDIFPQVLNNVPLNEEAVFTATLINESQSLETREYHLRVISTTNPDGAVVRVQGQNISHQAASFFLDYNTAANIALTIERGPLASSYDSIGIMMYPPCEYELWENNGNLTSGDTFYVSVNFLTECSNVSVINPPDNWLVNQNSNDQLTVDFSGYDRNNPFLQSLTLQYRELGDGWLDGPSIPKDSLVESIYRQQFDVSNLFDGEYSIRAKATCADGRGITYSSPLNGTIDRSSIAPFGIPSPADGFLRFGQEISVTFDKNIECTFGSYTTAPVISLIRADDSTAIPLKTPVDCSENEDRIILEPINDLFNDPTLKGVELIARVSGIEDQGGNVQEYPAIWSFVINVNPVYWDPEVLERAGFVGTTPVIQASLKNTATTSKAFTLTEYPTWLSPIQVDGSVLPNGEYELDFVVDPGLDPGIYTDTVTAVVDSQELKMAVTFKMLAIPPAWAVNPADFDYSMTVIAQFSLDNGNTQLAEDERDLIGAFVNGQPRGVGRIQYIPDVDAYAAFLTIYSNDAGGNNTETVSFRFWHALKGIEYGAVETTPFTNDATLGSISSPFVLHPDGIVQEIPLKKGWNWISLNVSNGDMSRENLLQSILSPQVGNDILIKNKEGKSSDYNGTSGWNGNLSNLDNNQGYMIHLSNQPDTLRVVGTPITPSPISVSSGWNWIGYQTQSIKTTAEALSSLTPSTGDIVKSQSEFAEYFATTGNWIGNLDFMAPGSAYKINLQASDNLTYPARTGAEAYQVVHESFESNMTVIAKVGFKNLSWVDTERFLIGAFLNDECRGYGKMQYVDKLGEYRIYLPVHGNIDDQGQTIEFRLLDTQTQIEYVSDANTETFVADNILGHILNPFVLFENLPVQGSYHLAQNVPNPFDQETVIRYVIPNKEHVRLSIFNQVGQQLMILADEVQAAGEHEFRLKSSDLAAGVYLYQLEAGDFRAMKKMMIVR